MNPSKEGEFGGGRNKVKPVGGSCCLHSKALPKGPPQSVPFGLEALDSYSTYSSHFIFVRLWCPSLRLVSNRPVLPFPLVWKRRDIPGLESMTKAASWCHHISSTQAAICNRPGSRVEDVFLDWPSQVIFRVLLSRRLVFEGSSFASSRSSMQ